MHVNVAFVIAKPELLCVPEQHGMSCFIQTQHSQKNS